MSRKSVKMAEKTFTVTNRGSTLDELRCSMCPGYLSCSPVRLLPNGKCICGSCSPLNTNAPIHRLVGFEALLSQIFFPCVFEKYGCTEMLPFDETADHEFKCAHKPFACPTSTSTTCPWEGSVSQLLHHFQNNHPDYLKEKAEFNLELGKDVQNIFMLTENSFAFIMKYFYNANQRILKYDTRLCANKNDLEVFSKMQLSNGADADVNINLKNKECSLYSETFYDMQKAEELTISKLLEFLGDPDSIVVTLKLSVVKPNSNSNASIDNISEVNFDLIKTLRCYKCHNYLVPPLFDWDGKTICCDCGEENSNCKSSNDTDLLECVNAAVYPCRWRECTFISKSNLYKDHVMKCQFRQYYCVYSDCNTFRLSKAAAHIQAHLNLNTVFIPDKIKFKTSFAKCYTPKHILTINNNRIMLIEHEMNNTQPPYLTIRMFQSREGAPDISGTVEFEHEHCTLEREFNIVLNTSLYVILKDLPQCFKVLDELTVTVKIIA